MRPLELMLALLLMARLSQVASALGKFYRYLWLFGKREVIFHFLGVRVHILPKPYTYKSLSSHLQMMLSLSHSGQSTASTEKR